MLFFIEKISRLDCPWNKKPLNEDDFYRLCRKNKITVQEMPLAVSGFYYCVKRQHFIAIDSKLPPKKKLFVMFHEIAHYLMHAPDTGVTANFHGVGKKTRKESEADAFALCALIPTAWIESRSDHELIEVEGFAPSVIFERKKIYEKYKI